MCCFCLPSVCFVCLFGPCLSRLVLLIIPFWVSPLSAGHVSNYLGLTGTSRPTVETAPFWFSSMIRPVQPWFNHAGSIRGWFICAASWNVMSVFSQQVSIMSGLVAVQLLILQTLSLMPANVMVTGSWSGRMLWSALDSTSHVSLLLCFSQNVFSVWITWVYLPLRADFGSVENILFILLAFTFVSQILSAIQKQ